MAGAYRRSSFNEDLYALGVGQSVGGRLEDDARGDLDLERRRNCQISTPAMSNASPRPAITSSIVEKVITCDSLPRPCVCHQEKLIRECAGMTCALWPDRMGRHPKAVEGILNGPCESVMTRKFRERKRCGYVI